MQGILEGIRVVDFTVWAVGPGGTALLGDLGADVIHIEELGRGNPLRGLHTHLSTSVMLPGNRPLYLELLNRNKRGIALDAKKPEGKQVIYDLVANSDVFVSNLRGKSLEKLALDYKTLLEYNPKLIYLHSTGYGSEGPAAQAGSLDLLAQARSGLMSTMGDPDKPMMVSAGLIDSITAIMVSYGVLAAFIARQRYGIGQFVETSQLGAALMANNIALTANLFTGQEFGGMRREQARNPIYTWYRCKDGRWLCLGCIQGDRYWSPFCKAASIEYLRDDPRFSTASQRARNYEELIAILDEVFATKTRTEWEKVLSKADLMYTRVNKMQDLASDPQVIQNEYIVNFDHPTLGSIKMIGQPVKYSKTPATLRSAAPDYAQHTEEVLREVCDYSWEKIMQLKEKEVI